MEKDEQKVINAAREFYRRTKKVPNSRELSWEHCYKQFCYARESKLQGDEVVVDNLCLHLAFYLASWGMYRGSSFLLERDYMTHKPIVEVVLNSEYDCLQGIEWTKVNLEEGLNRLNDLARIIRCQYNEIRKSVRGDVSAPISDVLITKVLLGTLGCVPAYDKNFMMTAGKYKLRLGAFSSESIKKLILFYKGYNKSFECVRKEMKVDNNNIYPQMKFLDMAFWQMGRS